MKYSEVKIFGLVLFVISLIIVIVFFGYFKLSLNFKLVGSDVIVNIDNNYEEIGYEASFLWKDLTDKVLVNNNVDSSKLGTYFVYYHVKYLWFDEVLKRRVSVIDNESPNLSLVGDDVVYYVGDKYKELGYQAIDNYDGDITDRVKVEKNVNFDKEGIYFICYSVEDSSGNESKINREVTVLKRKETIINDGGTKKENKGVIYLTFDDGPSASITGKILDILKEKGVKATFFVVNQDRGLDYLIKREYNEGHTVGIHSYTHDYGLIYRSSSNYYEDLEKMVNRVEGIIGKKSNIIRFPGGSSNTVSKKYKIGIMSELVEGVLDRGYHYFDWNIDSNDAGGAKSKEEIYNNVVSGLSLNRSNVVLMHDFDNNYITLEALSDIIDYGRNNGYTFKAISDDTKMIVHKVVN